MRAVPLGAVVISLSACFIAVGCGDDDAPRHREPGHAGEGGQTGGGRASQGGAGGEGGRRDEGGGEAAGGAFAGEGGTPNSALVGGANSAAGAGGDASAEEMERELVLSSISLSQTLEVLLASEGRRLPVAERSLPLVAGKRGLLRGYVGLAPSFAARTLTARLVLSNATFEQEATVEQRVGEDSRRSRLGTTFNFEIPATSLRSATSFSLSVEDESGLLLDRFPRTGFAEIEAEDVNPLELTIVPFVANGLSPDVSPERLESFRQRLLELYPLSDVVLRTRASVTLSGVFGADDLDAWNGALDELYRTRKTDGPPARVFYYGLLAPAPSFDEYCTEGCYEGLSVVGALGDVAYRGSVGIGFFPDGSGEDALDTMVHELGHAFGREHSPCGVSDAGPFPYESGGIGPNYGYDFVLGRLVSPSLRKDVMGYCKPVWVSDFTYSAVAQRWRAINLRKVAAAARALAVSAPAYRVVRLNASGAARFIDGESTDEVGGQPVELPLRDHRGGLVAPVQGRFFSLDHAGGGYLWLPQLALAGAAFIDLSPLNGPLLAL